MMRKIFVLFCLLISSIYAMQMVYPFKTAAQERQFHTLTTELRCLVCQNENLADSTAPLAKELRQQIYRMILSGKSNAQIKTYMVARYGDFILFKPPFQWNTLLLWSAPFVLLFAAAVVIVRLLK